MDWASFVDKLGLPGLMLGILWTVAKMWIESSERIALERIKVEGKRADATVVAMTSLSGKIDAHAMRDIQSHQEMATGIAEIHTKLDVVADLTPVRGVRREESHPLYPRAKTNPER